jgi:hypothetical protein
LHLKSEPTINNSTFALLLQQKQVYGIINGYHDKLEEPAANWTARKKAASKPG